MRKTEGKIEDSDVIKRFVKQANKNSKSKNKVAYFIMENTGQRLYVFTAEQLSLFGLEMNDAV